MASSLGISKMLLSLSLLATTGACGSSAHTPKNALHDYAEALRVGDASAAYSLMSAEFRSRYTREEFAAMLKDNATEAEQTAHRLATQSSQIAVTAAFDFGLDEHIKLVKQSGQWRIADNPLEFYSQKTPRATVRSFVRAYQNKRWEIMLRFVPTKYRERMTEEMIKKQFEGPRKAAMFEMMENLRVNIKSPISNKQKGNHVKLRYGEEYEVELVREQGVWKVARLQ